MKKCLILFVPILALLGVMMGVQPTAAAPNSCSSMASGTILPLTSIDITFNCTAEAAAYFGVCDNGPVPNDDLFTVVFEGQVVSFNTYASGVEMADIGSATAANGSNTMTVNSVNNQGGATYTVVVGNSVSEVGDALGGACGADFVEGSPSLGPCDRLVPVFTTDQAPSDGTLAVTEQFGTEGRYEGITVKTWDITAGQQLNNATAVVTTPQYVRVWWKGDSDTEWSLLTSQYWQGDGTLSSEYGLQCDDSSIPSYHTSFSSAIPESELPDIQ